MGVSKVTISDIAAAAGVSKATVSRFINGKMDLISASTRARIKKAITMSGYQPSEAARQLSLGEDSLARSDSIGLVIRDCNDPATLPLVQKCFSIASGNAQNVLAAFIDSDEGLEAAARQLLENGASKCFYVCPEANELKVLPSRA